MGMEVETWIERTKMATVPVVSYRAPTVLFSFAMDFLVGYLVYVLQTSLSLERNYSTTDFMC